MLAFHLPILNAAARKLLKLMIIPPTLPHCISFFHPTLHHHAYFKPLVGFPLLWKQPKFLTRQRSTDLDFSPKPHFSAFLPLANHNSSHAGSFHSSSSTHTLSCPKTLCVNPHSWNVSLHVSFSFFRSQLHCLLFRGAPCSHHVR